MNSERLLEVKNLWLSVKGDTSVRKTILRGVNLALSHQEILGLVGESGGGKTMVGKAILGLLPDGASIDQGEIIFEGVNILEMSGSERRKLLGPCISVILQNPMTALNPMMKIGAQVSDVLRHHLFLSKGAARAKAIELLESVRIRDPKRVVEQYPHELSGGMCQRVVIAIAFACSPKLIIADEPTTALDVTVQHQILKLIRDMQVRSRTSVLFVTHDLGVVSKICDKVSVIYAGAILETGETERVFKHPESRYMEALLDAVPRYDQPEKVLKPISSELHVELRREVERYYS